MVCHQVLICGFQYKSHVYLELSQLYLELLKFCPAVSLVPFKWSCFWCWGYGAWKCGVRYGKWSQEDRVQCLWRAFGRNRGASEALMVTVMSFAPLLTALVRETMDEVNKSKNKLQRTLNIGHKILNAPKKGYGPAWNTDSDRKEILVRWCFRKTLSIFDDSVRFPC